VTVAAQRPPALQRPRRHPGCRGGTRAAGCRTSSNWHRASDSSSSHGWDRDVTASELQLCKLTRNVVPSPSLHRDWHEVPPPSDSSNFKLSTYPSQARNAAGLHVLLVAAVNDPSRQTHDRDPVWPQAHWQAGPCPPDSSTK
jgi:hypothetical protein